MAQEKLVVVISESVTKSLIKDAGTFVMFAGLMYFNHTYLSGSTWIDLVFIIFVTLFLIGRNSSIVFRGTKKEAIKWLREEQ